MKIIETRSDFEEFSAIRTGCVLTIGNFDGVHIGHQKILTVAKQIAAERAAELVVMTFEPHPVAILHPEKAPGVLTPLELKKSLLADLDVDCLIVLKDSFELLNLSCDAFVDRFLIKWIRPSCILEGQNFNFGSGRTGDVNTLAQLGAGNGFEVVVIETKEAELSIGHSVKISSTIIRNILEAGKINDAALALSRPYRLLGPVISGFGRGRGLGFATANIHPIRQIIPVEGVYAAFVEIGQNERDVCISKEKRPAVLSIGRAETFGRTDHLMIEVHLLVENVGDLSGKWLAVDFIKHLRSQRTFASEKDLASQIAKDCRDAKDILNQQ